ncbi:MAG: cysteine-rich CWC family protein [Rubrivivax sp.]|nr:cysteine-rich CWC family protein [Rubrivivax sp.]
MNTAPPARPLPEMRCPLCGGPNGCLPAATGRFDTPCWCRDIAFPASLLAQVPADKAGRACVCAKCAQSAA